MDARSARILEYPVIRARLAGYTAFPPSRRLAEAMEPSADPVIVRRLLDETDQARLFLSTRPDVGLGGAHDIGPAVGRADRGGRLEPLDLVAIADTLTAAARLADSLREVELPRLHELYRQIVPLPPLRDRLAASIDPSGRSSMARRPLSEACVEPSGWPTNGFGAGSTSWSTASSGVPSRSPS